MCFRHTFHCDYMLVMCCAHRKQARVNRAITGLPFVRVEIAQHDSARAAAALIAADLGAGEAY